MLYGKYQSWNEIVAENRRKNIFVPSFADCMSTSFTVEKYNRRRGLVEEIWID
jgi:hypothetical protein